jgi:hypothetical protein
VVETAGNFHLCLAACSVGLAITFAANLASHWTGANGITSITEEDSMENETVHRKMVRDSLFSTVGDIGTAAVGGLLAA